MRIALLFFLGLLFAFSSQAQQECAHLSPTSVNIPAEGGYSSDITIDITYDGNNVCGRFSLDSAALHLAGQSCTRICYATVAGNINHDNNQWVEQVYIAATDCPATNIFKFQNSFGETVTATQICGPPCNLSILTKSLANGTVNSSYSQSIVAAGGTPPYTWLVSGLPSGLTDSLQSNGTDLISGTAANAGQANVLAKVTDSFGCTASASLQVGTSCDASSGINPLVQNVSPWGQETYDSSSFTIAAKGCALTTICMALGANGVSITPDVLNGLLDTYGGYSVYPDAGTLKANVLWSKDVAIVDDYFTGASSLNLKFDSFRRSGTAGLAAIDKYICSTSSKPEPVIVGVNLACFNDFGRSVPGIGGQSCPAEFPKGPTPGHYVIVTKKAANGDYSILDPAYGKTSLSKYGNNFETRGAVHDPSDLSFLEISSGENTDVQLVDPSSNKTGYDPISAGISEAIASSAYFRDRIDTVNPDGSTSQDPFTWHVLDVRQPEAGRYLLVIRGNSPGSYSILVDAAGIGGVLKDTIKLAGTIGQGQLISYVLQYSSLDTVPTTLKMIQGDLNGDGSVNCDDLAIVKASFGKKTGQSGFDPRADVNGDGLVNVFDLATVARQLPAGTVCQ